jgi:CBS domain-containing protein
VSDALAALVRAGEETALVTHRGVDVGVVTIDDLTPAGPTDLRTIGDVMRREVVCIDPRTDLEQTLRTYTDAGWSSAIRRRPGQPRA